MRDLSAGADQSGLVGVDDRLEPVAEPSLASTWVTCVLTVVSALDKPMARALRTALSRSVRARMASGSDAPSAGIRTYSSMTLCVTDGASSACPAATMRTAAGSSSAGLSLTSVLERVGQCLLDYAVSG